MGRALGWCQEGEGCLCRGKKFVEVNKLTVPDMSEGPAGWGCCPGNEWGRGIWKVVMVVVVVVVVVASAVLAAMTISGEGDGNDISSYDGTGVGRWSQRSHSLTRWNSQRSGHQAG